MTGHDGCSARCVGERRMRGGRRGGGGGGGGGLMSVGDGGGDATVVVKRSRQPKPITHPWRPLRRRVDIQAGCRLHLPTWTHQPTHTTRLLHLSQKQKRWTRSHTTPPTDLVRRGCGATRTCECTFVLRTCSPPTRLGRTALHFRTRRMNEERLGATTVR
jgi:hypothetical protein